MAPHQSWEEWYAEFEPFRTDLRDRILSAPEEAGDVFEGEDHFLFSRLRLRYLVTPLGGGRADPEAPVVETRSFKAIAALAESLKELGVHLIVVPVPSMGEVYPDCFSDVIHEPMNVSPKRTELIYRLLEQDVDVIDLLPDYLEARREGMEGLYCKDDPHWDTAGIVLAAERIAAAIAACGMEPPKTPVVYSAAPIDVAGDGALYKNLSEEMQATYEKPKSQAMQVRDPDGQPYKAPQAADILVAGDSFTNKWSPYGGDIAAHLALQLQRPVARLSGGGLGPRIPGELARKGRDYIQQHRIIVWIFVSRYLCSTEWRTVAL